VKLYTSGNFLWEVQDTLTSTYALTAYAIDHSGNVILGGYAFIQGFGTAEDFLVSKIDTSGVLDWQVRENGSGNSDDWVFDLCVDNYNNVFASGVFEDTARHKIFKYDTFGNRLWTKNIPDIGLNKVCSDPAGSFYVVGYDSVPQHEYIIYKYDSSGNHLHTTFSDLPDNVGYTQDYFVNIQSNDSGDVYLLHITDSSSFLRWMIAKLDSSLSIEWTTIYPDGGVTINPATPSALCLVDGGFIVSGRVDVLLRVIHFEETFPTGVKELSPGNKLTLWPNPVSENLFFQTNDDYSRESIYKIYDVNARLLMTGQLYGNDHSISMSTLNSGIYYLVIRGDDKIYSGTFLIH